MLVKIEARILIFPGTDFHFPSTSEPPGTFLGSGRTDTISLLYVFRSGRGQRKMWYEISVSRTERVALLLACKRSQLPNCFVDPGRPSVAVYSATIDVDSASPPPRLLSLAPCFRDLSHSPECF